MTIRKKDTSGTTNELIGKDGSGNIEASVGGVQVAGVGGDVPGVHDAAAGEVALGLAGEDGVDTL